MLFMSRFTEDINYLHMLQKRIIAFGNKDAVPDINNKLWILWQNIQACLNKEDNNYYIEVLIFSANISKKIEEYSLTHMLKDDSTVSRLLYELDCLKVCNYQYLNEKVTR